MRSTVYVMLAMLFWGIAPVFGKLGVTKSDPFLALVLRSFAISGILLVVLFASGKAASLTHFDPKGGALVIMEGISASLIGHLFYFYALKYGEVAWVVPAIAAYPLITAVIAYLLLGETLTVPQLIGAVLIICGVILIK